MTVLAGIRGFFSIPAGTKPTSCSCGKTIWWIEHRCKPKYLGDPGKISKLPIAIHGDIRALAPTSSTYGLGYNHLVNCPDAGRHREAPAHAGSGAQ